MLAATLAGQRVLVAYGLLGEIVAAMRPLGVDYMDKQVAWLRDSLAADVSVVRLPTAAPVAENAVRLRQILLSRDEPAVLVTHSKGGLEALSALLDPNAARRCRGLVAIQSPFGGSPVADAVVAAPPLRLAVGGAVRLIRRGSGHGIQDLTTAARRLWMSQNAEHITHLVESLPMVCCASSLVGGDMAAVERRYLPLVRWMERRGAGPNDGLVPVASALLPGARHVIVHGSHRDLVADGRGRDPVDLLRRLLLLALPASAPAGKLEAAAGAS